jgi:hypothetical protein
MEIDSRPLKLRTDDLRDDMPALAFALADTLRALNAEATHLLSVVTRPQTDVGRTLSRVQVGAVQIQEQTARAQDALETLTRALRAAGRL